MSKSLGMKTRFKVGDKVEYNGNLGVIVQLDGDVHTMDGIKKGALVEWDDNQLIPPQMGIPYDELLWIGPTLPKGSQAVGGLNDVFDIGEDPWCFGKMRSTDTHCPKCGTAWTKTPCTGGYWYDCLKCNAKKEDLV